VTARRSWRNAITIKGMDNEPLTSLDRDVRGAVAAHSRELRDSGSPSRSGSRTLIVALEVMHTGRRALVVVLCKQIGSHSFSDAGAIFLVP